MLPVSAAPTVADALTLSAGRVEQADRMRIRGWARDAASGAACRLRITDNGRTIAVVNATEYRADLVASGVGDGHHGFDVIVPGGLAPHVPHIIAVQTIAGGSDLAGSPCVIAAAETQASRSETPAPPAPAARDQAERPHGYLDKRLGVG